MRSPTRSAILLGLLFGLAATSTSAVTVALPETATELGITAPIAAWMISAYTISLAVGTPLQGRLADLYGIRAPLCVGVAALGVGAVVAALAPTFWVLIVARVIQGVGAAAVPVLATALISARWDGEIREGALGRVAGVSATVSSLGPLLGGALEQLGGWRAATALPVIALLALPMLWRAAPAGGSGESIDKVGALLVAMVAAGLVLLLQSPGAGWPIAVIGVVLLVVGTPLLVARVRRRPTGFLPRDIITNPTVLRSSFAAAAIPASWFALLLGVPLTAASWGWSPLATGLLLLPAAVMGFVVPTLSRRLMHRLGPRRTIAASCPVAVVALLLAALGGALRSPVLLAAGIVLVTVAFGIGQPAMTAAVSSAVDPQERGVALGVATLLFLTGASVGAALVAGLVTTVGVAGVLAVLAVLPVAGWWVISTGRRAAPVPAG